MKRKLTLIAAVSALFVLIFASREVIESSRYGLRLCIELILPTLFPFFLVSVLLNKLGFPFWLGRLLGPAASRLFHVSGAGITALFVGLTGGYPMGAAYIAELIQDRTISEKEGERLLAFCNNSGPAFLIGGIGTGVFGSAGIGLRLYAVHIVSAVLTGLLFRGDEVSSPAKPMPIPETDFRLPRLLTDAVQRSVAALLNVCGFLVCFCVFTGLLDACGLLARIVQIVCTVIPCDGQALRALLIGFWELGSGIGAMQGFSPTPPHLALAAALAAWGGISVHFQTFAVLSETNVKGALHTAGRLTHALLSYILMYGFMLLRI